MGRSQKKSEKAIQKKFAKKAALGLAKRVEPKTLDCLVERFFDMKCKDKNDLKFRNNVVNRALGNIIEDVAHRPFSYAQINMLIRLLCMTSHDDAITHLNDLLESLGRSRYDSWFESAWGANAVLKIIDVVCAHHDNREWFIALIPDELKLNMIPFLTSLPNNIAERFIESLFPPPPLRGLCP